VRIRVATTLGVTRGRSCRADPGPDASRRRGTRPRGGNVQESGWTVERGGGSSVLSSCADRGANGHAKIPNESCDRRQDQRYEQKGRHFVLLRIGNPTPRSKGCADGLLVTAKRFRPDVLATTAPVSHDCSGVTATRFLRTQLRIQRYRLDAGSSQPMKRICVSIVVTCAQEGLGDYRVSAGCLRRSHTIPRINGTRPTRRRTMATYSRSWMAVTHAGPAA